MPPRENWPWEEKVSKNTQIKLFSEEYHGVNCSLPSPRPHYSARPKYLGSRGPSVSDTSPKWIDREGLGKRRTRTRQNSKHADAWTAPFKFHRYVSGNVLCTVCICVCMGGVRPVFVCLFVFWIPRRATRLFVNGFRYFYFIYFVHLFCHYFLKHTHILRWIYNILTILDSK